MISKLKNNKIIYCHLPVLRCGDFRHLVQAKNIFSKYKNNTENACWSGHNYNVLVTSCAQIWNSNNNVSLPSSVLWTTEHPSAVQMKRRGDDYSTNQVSSLGWHHCYSKDKLQWANIVILEQERKSEYGKRMQPMHLRTVKQQYIRFLLLGLDNNIKWVKCAYIQMIFAIASVRYGWCH